MFKYLTDSLVNLITGLGTTSDKTLGTQHYYVPLNPAELEAAFRSDWICRKCVSIPAQDATREWRAWQADKDSIEKIENEEKRLGIQRKTRDALIQARLYGGSVMIMGVKGDDPQSELDAESVGLGDLQFVHVLHRYEVNWGPIIRDVTSPWYGEPSWWSRSGAGNDVTLKIHPSRVVVFQGNPIVAFFSKIGQDEPWGDSVLQAVNDAVKAAGIVQSAITTMMTEASVDVIGVPGLTETVANKDYRDRLIQRFQLAQTSKSINNALILDKEEEWNRITHNFAGLIDILMGYMQIASGAADIPATRLLGQSPAGLNATGESDLKNYYDSVGDGQKNVIQPRISRLDDVLIVSATGKRDPSIFYIWTPLWQLDEVQKSDLFKKKAETYQLDASNWIGDPAVLQKAREQQLIDDGVYPNLEMLIEDSKDHEDLMSPELTVPALQPPPPQLTPPGPGNRPNGPPPRAVVQDSSGRRRPVSIFDLKPRTLYVRRDVRNADAILAWARAQGFTDLYEPGELHVTIIYSKVPVDWMKVAQDHWGSDSQDGSLHIPPGGPRAVEAFGQPMQEVVVLAFASNALQYRHQDFCEGGAQHAFPEYQPHISFSRKPSGVDLETVTPYRGAIELGPEIFEEVDV
jgi:phage-related protein (TIGR01555 family)